MGGSLRALPCEAEVEPLLVTVPVVGAEFHALVMESTVVFATFGDPPPGRPAGNDHPVAGALRAYASGEITAIDSLQVSQSGSPFRKLVWQALRTIAAGHPISYAQLAALTGRPAAVRAAACGCATNQIPLIVPCHRVLRSDGSLGGYAFGLELKRRLLDHEAGAPTTLFT